MAVSPKGVNPEVRLGWFWWALEGCPGPSSPMAAPPGASCPGGGGRSGRPGGLKGPGCGPSVPTPLGVAPVASRAPGLRPPGLHVEGPGTTTTRGRWNAALVTWTGGTCESGCCPARPARILAPAA